MRRLLTGHRSVNLPGMCEGGRAEYAIKKRVAGANIAVLTPPGRSGGGNPSLRPAHSRSSRRVSDPYAIVSSVTAYEMKATALRAAMVDRVERDFPHLGTKTLKALRQVPRHVFVPEIDLEKAYIDDAVVTRRDGGGRSISSISQPSLVAQMLDMLDLRPGLRVLEIGAGTGYNAALLAEIVGPTGAVTTIDLDREITDEADRNLDAAGYSRVTVTCGDGALGDPAGAPWDRIIVSVGAWEPAPEWIAQLASDGKLVQPLSLGRIQRIVAFAPAACGLRSTQVLCGGFLAQRGRDAPPRTSLALSEGITIESSTDLGIDTGDLLALLASAPARVWTGVMLPPPGRFDRLIVHLALHHQDMFTLTAPRTFLPEALRAWSTIYCITSDAAIAHLALRPSDPADLNGDNEVGVFAYGPGAAGLAQRLAAEVRSWERVRDLDPVFEINPHSRSVDLDESGAVVLDKCHSRIRVTWPAAPESAIIEMRLLDEYFDLVVLGKKTVEVRANDRKRADVQPGSHIRFLCGDRALEARVTGVRRYRNFAALYEAEDAARINPGRSAADQLVGIEELYGPDKRSLGAVAIELCLLDDATRASEGG